MLLPINCDETVEEYVLRLFEKFYNMKSKDMRQAAWTWLERSIYRISCMGDEPMDGLAAHTVEQVEGMVKKILPVCWVRGWILNFMKEKHGLATHIFSPSFFHGRYMGPIVHPPHSLKRLEISDDMTRHVGAEIHYACWPGFVETVEHFFQEESDRFIHWEKAKRGPHGLRKQKGGIYFILKQKKEAKNA